MDLSSELLRSFHLSDGTICTLKNFFEQDVDRILSIEERVSIGPWSRKHFLNSVSNSHICAGVEIDEAWVAYSVFSLAADTAELLLIAVDDDWQNKGIARSLIETMSELLAANASELFLEVRASNLRAIHLYESLEFNQVGVRKNYYPMFQNNIGQREDALIYGKVLIE